MFFFPLSSFPLDPQKPVRKLQQKHDVSTISCVCVTSGVQREGEWEFKLCMQQDICTDVALLLMSGAGEYDYDDLSRSTYALVM